MKVELIGISKEAFQPPEAADMVDSKPQYQVIARLGCFGGGPYIFLSVPVEMVGDAKIGDEFTLYLERVKK